MIPGHMTHQHEHLSQTNPTQFQAKPQVPPFKSYGNLKVSEGRLGPYPSKVNLTDLGQKWLATLPWCLGSMLPSSKFKSPENNFFMVPRPLGLEEPLPGDNDLARGEMVPRPLRVGNCLSKKKVLQLRLKPPGEGCPRLG